MKQTPRQFSAEKQNLRNLSPEQKQAKLMEKIDKLKCQGWELVNLKRKDGEVTYLKGFKKTLITSFDEATRYEARGLSYEEDDGK